MCTIIHLFIVITTILKIHVHGLPVMLNPRARPRNPEEVGGYFEGDIKFPPAEARSLADSDNNVLWPNNTVPYEISPLYTPDQAAALIFGMRLLENLTAIEGVPCITFRPKVPSDGNYSIYIYSGPGCSSFVGRHTGSDFNRTTSINYPGCFTNGSIMHEYLHVLGFYHEQSRPDRDNYVKINSDTIIPGYLGNFAKYTTNVDTVNTPYDYGSVMHYPRDAFSINGSDTIVPLDPTAQIGQRITLSPLDIQAVRTFYSCSGPNASTTTTSTIDTVATVNSGTMVSITLTRNSPTFDRIGGTSSDYYYITREVIVSVSSVYTFTSFSTFAVYTYLYTDNFDPQSPSSNLLAQGHNIAGDSRFQFSIYLSNGGGTGSKRKRATARYILVTTTEDAGVTGSGFVMISGPSLVIIINSDNSTTVLLPVSQKDNNSGKNNAIITGTVVGGTLFLIYLCSLCVACIFVWFCPFKGRPFRNNKLYVRDPFYVGNDTSNTIFRSKSFSGFYFKDGRWDKSDRFALSFYPKAKNIIYGRGTDHLGRFIATGIYSPRTLRMAFDKHYQSLSTLTDQIMTVQVSWNPHSQSFEGKYYLKAGKYREEEKYVIRMTV